MRMTSTGASRRALAAAKPPNPPPTITTRGVLLELELLFAIFDFAFHSFSSFRAPRFHRFQGLPFETLCIESCLTAVVVVTGGLAVGHGIFERDPSDLERLQECRCRVA